MNIEKKNKNSENYIYWTTIRRFKGLERNVIIIVDLNNLETDENKFILHTGLTRSTDKVIVLMNDNLNNNFDKK